MRALLTVPENHGSVDLWGSIGELERSDVKEGGCLSEGAELLVRGSGISECLWSFVLSKRNPRLVERETGHPGAC